ncbi:carboxypeptidase-like regulatory domain-containing protein [Myroides sp. WP-1]|uniref:carboxypeptidase-like regulatory domain-containing protein n=1 Tax=Myroides sp. WP-1 TaxID=2759944 RepID=UPI0015F9F4C2|nr:carboxypeptidase-like regulatory domain-containing protein [Myroides sp. WP-1]MBB1140597.1 TonB-dependent receptor [Myroides sp. WP-1]
MRKLLFVLLCATSTFSFAQDYHEIRGKVLDAKSRIPINAVHARIVGTNISTLTNGEGIFVLELISSEEQTVELSYPGYVNLQLYVTREDNSTLDLGEIILEEDLMAQAQIGFITLTENDLSDDNSGSDTSSGLLQATKDPFQQVAAFNWGQSFFKVRGLNNEYGKTLINGVVMNRILDGRPQFSNWGGLNDVMRNQEFSSGSKPSDYTYGSILGTQAISTRASHIRKGSRAVFSGSNTNYNWRPTFMHSSGLNKKGWAYVVAGSYRGAKEGYWEGTNYDALSFFTAVEKKFNEEHSLNFSAIYAKNKRGKNAPLTQEQADLKGFKYNSYWGWQEGDKRNSRYRDIEQPIFMLTHYWNMNEKTSLTTTASYQFGYIADSRFSYQNNLNPDPAYYKYLPSYYTTQIDPSFWTMTPEQFNSLSPNNPMKVNTISALKNAEENRISFIEGGQVDWNNIYATNNSFDGRSKIVLYEDRQQEKIFALNSSLKRKIDDNITFDAGINYRKLTSNNYQKLTDLLGGWYYLDIDTYQKPELQDKDNNNPNRQVKEGDKFGYNYKLYADVVDVFAQLVFDYGPLDFYFASNLGYTNYQREGLYKNPVYMDNSYGKSGHTDFTTVGLKGGATYQITGKHALDVNISYHEQAPTIKNTFANVRVNNALVPSPKNEDIFSVDGSYILRTPKLKARVTGYFSEIHNSTKINFYFADGAGLRDENGELYNNGNSFVSEVLTGINKRHLGLEIGAEYQLTPTVKATAAAALGQAFYTSNPNVYLSSDNLSRTFDYGEAALKKYKLSNGPQTALSLGLEYRDPAFWFVGANVNYMADAYTDVSALRRTRNFVLDPTTPGQPFTDITDGKLRQILKQEKLNDFTIVNITGGKSWRLPNRTIVGFFASINNVFNKVYKTGGFEQARNANYKQEIERNSGPYNRFGNKYFYGYGRNFFVNVYYNF